jgi:hypothetical protein
VLQILSWWRGLLGVEGTEDWDSAVGDVTWVMKQVLHPLINPSKKRVHDDDLESSDQNDVMLRRLPKAVSTRTSIRHNAHQLYRQKKA